MLHPPVSIRSSSQEKKGAAQMQVAIEMMAPRAGDTTNAIFDMINAVPGAGPVLMGLALCAIFGLMRLVAWFRSGS